MYVYLLFVNITSYNHFCVLYIPLLLLFLCNRIIFLRTFPQHRASNIRSSAAGVLHFVFKVFSQLIFLNRSQVLFYNAKFFMLHFDFFYYKIFIT